MGHNISVFVIKKKEAIIDLSKVVHSEDPNGEFIIIPEEAVWEGNEGEEEPLDALKAISSKISKGKVAYLTTDYFGGIGDQTGELFDPSLPHYHYESDSINKALEKLGVVKNIHPNPAIGQEDEFDTIRLGNFRSNSDFYPKVEKTKITTSMKISALEDSELKKLIWEEWESEIKEGDPREMVFKYMKMMRDGFIAK